MVALSDSVSATLIVGTWYISVVCACKNRVIFFRDLTNGKGTLQGTLGFTCPACHKWGAYEAEHYQYNPERQLPTPIS